MRKWAISAFISLFCQLAFPQGTIILGTNSAPGNLGPPILYNSPPPGWTLPIRPISLFPPIPTISFPSDQTPPPPGNDHLTNAFTLVGPLATAEATNYSATAEPGEPAHDGFVAARSVWWQWTAPSDGIAEVQITALAYVSPALNLSSIISNAISSFMALFGVSPLVSIPQVPTNFQAFVVTPTNIAILSGSGGADSTPSTPLPRSLIPLAVGVYTGDSMGSLTEVAMIAPETFDDGSGGAVSKKYRFAAMAGQTYRITADSAPRLAFRLNLTLGREFIAEPTPTTRLHASQPINIQFQSFSTNDSITWIEAFVGTNSLGILTGSPFTFTYTASLPGWHSFSAVATNSLGERVLALSSRFLFTPANDDFADATRIAGNAAQGSFTEQILYATGETGEPLGTNGWASSNSVWWAWAPVYPGQVTVTLTAPGSIQDVTRLRLYKGESLAALQLINAMQAGFVTLPGQARNPSFPFTPEAGATYYFALDGTTAVSWKYDQRTIQLLPSTTPQPANVNLPVTLHANWQEDSAPSTPVEFVIGTLVYPQILTPLSTPIVEESGTLGTDSSFPYDLSWTPQNTGRYFVWARTTNNLGYVKESAMTEFRVYAANDAFTNATVIDPDMVETNLVFDSTWTSAESGELRHHGDPVLRSCWWSWTPSHSQNVRIKAVQLGAGLPLDVFTRDTSGRLRLVADNGNRLYLPGVSGFIRLPAKSGRTYYVRVSDTRNLFATPVPPGTPIPEPPSVNLSIEPANNPLAGEVNFTFFASQLTRNKYKPATYAPIARVYLKDGVTPVPAEIYLAQLYAGPSESMLQPVGTARPFYNPNGTSVPSSWAGAPFPEVVVLPNVKAYQHVVAQVRVWNTLYGSTYEEAVANNGPVGQSGMLRFVAGSEQVGPAPLKGLTSFRVNK